MKNNNTGIVFIKFIVGFFAVYLVNLNNIYGSNNKLKYRPDQIYKAKKITLKGDWKINVT